LFDTKARPPSTAALHVLATGPLLNGDPDMTSFPRSRVRAGRRYGTEPRPALFCERSLGRDRRRLLIATCGSRRAVELDSVITIGPGALLSSWRGYAEPAPEDPCGPCFECARGLLAEIASALLFARSETGRRDERRGADTRLDPRLGFPREEHQLLARFRLAPADASTKAITRTQRRALPQCHGSGSLAVRGRLLPGCAFVPQLEPGLAHRAIASMRHRAATCA